MRKLCSYHAALATPMWGPIPADIHETLSTHDCLHCQYNRILVPKLLEIMEGDNFWRISPRQSSARERFFRFFKRLKTRLSSPSSK